MKTLIVIVLSVSTCFAQTVANSGNIDDSQNSFPMVVNLPSGCNPGQHVTLLTVGGGIVYNCPVINNWQGLYGWATATYVQAVDGNGPGTITPAINSAIPAGAIIREAELLWSALPTSGGSATISIGVTGTGGGTAVVLASTAFGSIVAKQQPVIVPQTASTHVNLTTQGTITITVGTAGLTGGVCKIWLLYVL